MEVVAICVARYAALVATGSLGWQIYSWAHRQRPHVELVRGG
jgi:hypothetical protein